MWECLWAPLLLFFLEPPLSSLLSRVHRICPWESYRPTLLPSPKASRWSPSGLAHQHHCTQQSPPFLGSSLPSLAPLSSLPDAPSSHWPLYGGPGLGAGSLLYWYPLFLADLPWSWVFMPTTPQFLSPAWTSPLSFRFWSPSALCMSNRLLKVDTSKHVFLILPLQTHFSPDVLHLVKWQTSSSQMLGLKTLELSLIFFFLPFTPHI